MVHPQRTSDERRPGRGRQRINPREFATTGPRTPETAANYLLHRGLRQDGGGDQRGVSKNPPQCRGSWPGFESEPSSLERLIPDHLLTGKPRTSAIRLADGESSRDQFDPTDRAGGTTGLEPVMPGMAGAVGLPSRAGALGNRTGSRAGRSLPCSPLHPETKNRVAITAARPNVLFISQLLRE